MDGLYLPPKPAIVRLSEPWEAEAHEFFARKGIPWRVRLDLIKEWKRLLDARPSILKGMRLDLARFADVPPEVLGTILLNPYVFGVGGLTASLDHEAGSSQYLSRTNGGAGSNSKMTFSIWLLRESVGASMHVWGGGNNGQANPDGVFFQSDNTLRIENGGSVSAGGGITGTTFASTSTWYHVFISWDAAQTGVAKSIIRINGATPTFPSFDGRASFTTTAYFNAAVTQWIGRVATSATSFFDGLTADARFYNAVYAAETDFGQDNGGTWTRKKSPTVYTFGTNGYNIDGSGAVGTDVSGNGNNYTNNGTIVTSASVPPEI